MLGLFALLLAFAGLAALAVRRDLERGRQAMNRGKQQLIDGNGAEAAKAFDDAEAAFGRAEDGAGHPALRVLSWMPYLGRTPDAIGDIAVAGRKTAQAGGVLAEAFGQLPDGFGSLAPRNGRVPLEQLGPLADAVARADALTGEALGIVAGAPSHLLLGPVGGAREDAEAQLRDLHGTLRTADLLLAGLPGFLGVDGERRYMFIAENPAELRATGGIWGAYAILTIEDGGFRFSRFRQVEDLPQLQPGDVPVPGGDYAKVYDQFRDGDGFWLNANMSPDFPSAAAAVDAGYEEAGGTPLDGVITADPFALRALLQVTGPARIPQIDQRITAENVVGFTTNEVYLLFPTNNDAAKRKLILGEVAKSVVDRFLQQTTATTGRIKTLADAASEGHIHVWVDDPAMELGLSRTGVGGALAPPPGAPGQVRDFLAVAQNNSAGNKLDFYLDRTVTYAVTLSGDGEAHATATVRLENGAPTTGMPKYVIGPFPGVAEAGENVATLGLYCADGCGLENATLDGSPTDVVAETELGHPFFFEYLRTPSGGTSELALSWFLPRAWEGNSSGGTYRLTVLGQPTVRPTHVRIEVRLPDGTHLTSSNARVAEESGLVVWEGVPSRRFELELEFQASLPLRLWRDATRWLSKPIPLGN